MTTSTPYGMNIEPGSTAEQYTEDERIHLTCCIDRGYPVGSCITRRIDRQRPKPRRQTSHRLTVAIPA